MFATYIPAWYLSKIILHVTYSNKEETNLEPLTSINILRIYEESVDLIVNLFSVQENKGGISCAKCAQNVNYL